MKEFYQNEIIKNFLFKLTNAQNRSLEEIKFGFLKAIKECLELFRDVGSGKIIVSLLTIANVLESNYQCALMGPN